MEAYGTFPGGQHLAIVNRQLWEGFYQGPEDCLTAKN
jgi:hypothetical protein